jgi:hypothetical protein
MKILFAGLAASCLWACAPAQPPDTKAPPAEVRAVVEQPADPFDAADTAFEPIEPTVVGVIAAPTVWQALAPLYTEPAREGDHRMSVRIARRGDGIVADVLRLGLPDDSVAAEQVRIEFREEPEGWFPTNAWRRIQCRRGERDEEWTLGLCP